METRSRSRIKTRSRSSKPKQRQWSGEIRQTSYAAKPAGVSTSRRSAKGGPRQSNKIDMRSMFAVALLALMGLLYWTVAYLEPELRVRSSSSTMKSTATLLGVNSPCTKAILQWIVSGDEVETTKEIMHDMSYSASLLTTEVDVWLNSLPRGPEIHALANKYRDMQNTARTEMREFHLNRTFSLAMLNHGIEILPRRLGYILHDYNTVSYFLAHHWYTSIVRKPKLSPLGTIDYTIIRQQVEILSPMAAQSYKLVHALTRTQDALEKVEEEVKREWSEWESKCAHNAKGIFGGTKPKEKFCHKLDPKGPQGVLMTERDGRKALAAGLKDVQGYAEKQLHFCKPPGQLHEHFGGPRQG